MSTFRLAASWLLAIGLAVFFVHITLHPWPDPVPGYVKLYDAPGESLLFAALAEGSGVTIFEPAGRFVSAIIELIVAGVALHLSPWMDREIALPEGGTDGGTHFLVYVIFLALALLLLVVHPGSRNRF
jgi:hypothetical protein